MNQLSAAIREANELAEKAHSLSDKLKIIELTAQNMQSTAVADPFIFGIAIFILTCIVGYYIVLKVTPALYNPLMSVTNAISGIIIIGALIASGSETFGISSLLGLVAVFLASINIFGGFILTERTLGMFKRK